MNRLTNPVLMLVPHELLGGFLLIFLVMGGICRIVGAKQASTSLIVTAIAIPFVTVVVEALFNELFAVLPLWLVKIVAWLVLVTVYLCIFGALMTLLLGQRVWGETKSHLLVGTIKAAIRIVFSWPLLLLFGGIAVYLSLK